MGRSALGLVTAGAVVLVVSCAEQREAPTSSVSFHNVSSDVTCEFGHTGGLISQYFPSNEQQGMRALLALMQAAGPATPAARDAGFRILEGIELQAAVNTNVTTGSDLANHLIACMFDPTSGDDNFPASFPVDFTDELDPAKKGAFGVRFPTDGDASPVLARNGAFSGVAPVDIGATHVQLLWKDILEEPVLLYGQPVPNALSYEWKSLRPGATFLIRSLLPDTAPGLVIGLCLEPDGNDMLQENTDAVLGFNDAAFLLDAECNSDLDDPLGGSATGIKSVYSSKDVPNVFLTFTSEDPDDRTLGAELAPTPVVQATDATGDPVGGVRITLTLVNNNGTPAELSPDAARTRTTGPDGIASFPGLSATKTGGYRLLAAGAAVDETGAVRNGIQVGQDVTARFNIRPAK